jgi:hypothetical protein
MIQEEVVVVAVAVQVDEMERGKATLVRVNIDRSVPPSGSVCGWSGAGGP